MNSKRALKKQIAQAKKLLRYALEKCEEQQVISGCCFDEEKCTLCPTFKGQYTARELFESLSKDQGAAL